MTTAMVPLVLEESLTQQLISWAKEAAPDEACGVIVEGQALRLTNVSPEPEAYFHIDDEELMSVYRAIGVPSAIWHSHPNGDPAPSSADIDGTPPGMLMVIVAAGAVHVYSVD